MSRKPTTRDLSSMISGVGRLAAANSGRDVVADRGSRYVPPLPTAPPPPKSWPRPTFAPATPHSTDPSRLSPSTPLGGGLHETPRRNTGPVCPEPQPRKVGRGQLASELRLGSARPPLLPRPSALLPTPRSWPRPTPFRQRRGPGCRCRLPPNRTGTRAEKLATANSPRHTATGLPGHPVTSRPLTPLPQRSCRGQLSFRRPVTGRKGASRTRPGNEPLAFSDGRRSPRTPSSACQGQTIVDLDPA